jgi:hypothetical protein
MVKTQYVFYGVSCIAKLRKGQVLPFYLSNQGHAFNSRLARTTNCLQKSSLLLGYRQLMTFL